MEMTGEQHIPAPPERVWEALNDPDILKASIPGCQELNKVGDTGFEATVKAKVGPVSATFVGNVELSNINPPQSYTISGEGKGGVAGFAKGGADVSLVSDGGGTLLSYTVRAQVGGKLAQIGSRLIDSTAKKMAGQFFTKFSEVVCGDGPGSSSGDMTASTGVDNVTDTAASLPADNRSSGGLPRHWMWVSTIAAAGIALWLLTMFGNG